VNVISNTADLHKIGIDITTDCREISVHARPHIGVEPGLAVLRANDDVQNDFA
jgi:hypothetical protein